jgi:hypothetical protein
MHTKGIISLVVTVLLCLPSIAGASMFLGNLLLQRRIEEWGAASSGLVALTVFIGGPLVALAVVISALVGLSHNVPRRIKCANYVIVGVAALVTFSLQFRFGM